jgi:alcohol dehydrogenase class IV
MTTSLSNFNIPGYEICFGPGSLTLIPDAITPLHIRQLIVLASPSIRKQGYIKKLETILEGQVIEVYDHVGSHVQDYQLAEVVDLALKHELSGIIGIGGGSAIGMAKALSDELGKKSANQKYPAVIAIPTTYAGSEMTPVYGVTHNDQNPPRKMTVRNPQITPKVVVYDPELALGLPTEVTASTGINALAHCIEALYSVTHNVLASASALDGIRQIVKALPQCTTNGTDLEARTKMFAGSHLAGFALALTSMGLHHGLCHVLGGSAGVPHGVANSIILPHAMRFNLDFATAELALVGRAMGKATETTSDNIAADRAIKGIDQFISDLGLPQRLRDAGVSQNSLSQLAQVALKSKAVQDNPRRVTDVAEIEALLREAW